MFGLKPKKQQSPEISEPAKAQAVIKPCDDEPSEWSALSEQELAATWYRLESISSNFEAITPQVNGDDFEWYQHAASQGDRCAQYVLGKMFHRGILTQPALFQAGLWYSKASEAGSPFADYELAKMCEFGVFMKRDEEMASKLYRKAYQVFMEIEGRKPNRAVEKKLASLCEKGVADPQEADRWKRLAEQEPESTPEIQEVSPMPTSAVPREEDLAQKHDPDQKSSSMLFQDIPVKYIFPSKENKYGEKDTDQQVHALASSIRINGLISPLTVNKISDSEYRIVAGEKRFKAITSYLHWETIPAIIKSNLTENAAASMLHAANLDVRQYTAAQKLQFYQDYYKRLSKRKESCEFQGPQQDEIVELLGLSSHQIRKYQRIVEILPTRKLRQIKDGKLSIEKAYKMTLTPKEIPSGRTSNLEEKRDVISGRKSGQYTVQKGVPKSSERSGQQTGRTSDFKAKADVVEGPRNRLFYVTEDVPGVPNPLEISAESTSDFRVKKDVVGGRKAGLIYDRDDVQSPQEKLEQHAEYASGFITKTDVVKTLDGGCNSVSEDVQNRSVYSAGRESAFGDLGAAGETGRASTRGKPDVGEETGRASARGNPDVGEETRRASTRGEPDVGDETGRASARGEQDMAGETGRASTRGKPDVGEETGRASVLENPGAVEETRRASPRGEPDVGDETGRASARGTPDVGEETGRASVLGNPDAVEETGCASTLGEPDVAEKTGRASARGMPDVAEKTGRASARGNPDVTGETGRASYSDPATYQDVITTLARLPTVPGERCAVLSDGKVEIGKIDHISLYKNALLIIVKIDGVRHSYPVSMIGRNLFFGSDYIRLVQQPEPISQS